MLLYGSYYTINDTTCVSMKKKKKHSDLLLSCRCCLFLFFLCLSWVSLCSHLWHGLACGSGRCCGWGCPLLVLGHLQTIITFALTLVMLCIEHAEDSDALVCSTSSGAGLCREGKAEWKGLLQILLLHLWLLYCRHRSTESVTSD